MNSKHFDVVVVGAGPGGSTLASLLAKKNFNVALIEKEAFPRFKIGESLLPHSMDILKESGAFDKIDSGKYIRKYGAAFIDYREADPVCFEFSEGLDSDHQFAFEVPRDEFDKDLLEHAASVGVEVLQPCQVREINLSSNPVQIVTDTESLTCDYVADATGRNALLGTQFQSRNKNDHFINNVAVFNHYNGVKRDLQKNEGDIIIGILPEQSWSWHIPFKGEVTSVGVVCSPENFKKNNLEKGDIVQRLLQCHPSFIDLMADAEPLREQTIVSNYSYSSTDKIGENWIMVGDAATFLDPVFSSGVHISLCSASLAAKVLTEALESKTNLKLTSRGATYQVDLQKGVDRFQSLLLLFYKTYFVKHMKKIIQTELLYKSFTSAFSGDMWNDDNCLFRLGVLKDGRMPDEKYLI